jgi:hypothetical protein
MSERECREWSKAGKDQTRLHTGVVVRSLVELGERYGWKRVGGFFHVFLPTEPLPPRYVIDSIPRQTTFVAAAYSVACGADLRPWFRERWGFEIIDSFYAELMPQLERNLRCNELLNAPRTGA